MTEKSEFEKRFQEIANHIPLGILDTLHLRKRHAVYIPQSFLDIVDEAQKDIFPLPKGNIIQNNRTGERDKIVLELKEWLPFINKLRNWFGDKK